MAEWTIETKALLQITYHGKLVAEIDMGGNYKCFDKEGLVQALLEEGELWRKASEMMKDVQASLERIEIKAGIMQGDAS